MDPQTAFCPNPDCPARGQCGEGNVAVHSQKERRYRCRVCGQTFSARQGTAFYRVRTAEETITLVVTLLANGCPLQAIVVAFGFDERTVQAWQRRAGHQCEQVQVHLVQQPRDLGQVQADEIWVKLQGLKVWMATLAPRLRAAQVQVWRCKCRPACGWAGRFPPNGIGP